MRRSSLRALVLLALASAVFLICTATAYAGLTSELGISVNSAGDAGSVFGNQSSDITWYNHDVSLTATPTIDDSGADSNITVNYLAYSFNGSAFASITANPFRTFSAEGRYSLDASGTDDLDAAFEGTITIGIDKTRPTSSSDAVPVYDSTATIVMKAADALSGSEYLLYSLDGAADYATPTASFPATTVPMNATVVSKTSGMHTLSWFAVDNAGNFELAHSITFQINAAGYTPALGKPTASVKKKTVTFKGTVTAATSNMTVKLTVQRKSGKKFKGYTTYSVTAQQYAGTYAIAKTIKKKGTYRVTAAEGTGTSAWSRNFVVK